MNVETYVIPKTVTRVTECLSEAGFDAYLVGGCVRDLVLGKKPKDWDITTNAHPEQIQALFDETYYTNEYGTVGVVTPDPDDLSCRVVEVTPYRKESTYSDGRRPDSVEFGVTLEEDLARRDFTINAIAYNQHKGHTVDPYKGHEDIGAHVLRAVGDPNERFREDALRMLRAIRIGAEIGFAIEQKTFEAIAENAKLLEKVSKERIRDEFSKVLLSSRPMEALLHMKHTNTLQYVVPELEHGVGVAQNKAHSYNVFEHLLRSVQHAADKGYSLEIRLAALFHDVSKPECRRKSEKGEWTFYGHEVVGSRVTRSILQKLHFSNETIEIVAKLVRWHMFFSDPDKITLSAVRRMIANVGEDHIWDLLNVRLCDRIGSGRPKEQPFRFRVYKSMVEEALRDPIHVSMLKINGARVMDVTHETPGPRIGNILHALLEEVLDDPTKNTETFLEDRARLLSGCSDTELAGMGAHGKERKSKEDADTILNIRKKHGVAR